MRRAFTENLGLVESFHRDVSILEEAGILFADDKIREYELAAASLRQVSKGILYPAIHFSHRMRFSLC